MKDELGAGVLPSQRFGANAAWFRINAITYNLLTLLKRRALPERFRLARPKRLRFEIFNMPARLSVHQSQLIATLSARGERSEELVRARQRLLVSRQGLGQSPVPTRSPPPYLGARARRPRRHPCSDLSAFLDRRPIGLGTR